MTSIVGDTTVPAALTLSFAVWPTVAVGAAVMVNIDVPPADVTDAGANAVTRPVGAPVTVSVAFSATPAVLVSVTVVVAMPPTGTLTISGATSSVKSLTTMAGFDTTQAPSLFDHSFCTV